MNAIYSIRKPFTDLIFDGTKTIEFRNRIGKYTNLGDRIYVYETKAKGGLGRVIGYVTIEDIIEIPSHKVGTYPMLHHYIEKYGTEEEKSIVKRAMSIELRNCDNSLVLNHLYNEHVISYMEEHKEAPDPWSWELNQIPNSFNGYSCEEYNRRHDLSDKLCEDCDEWLQKIGYYNEEEVSDWKYAIKIANPVVFTITKGIEVFHNQEGNPISRAPQSWCYTTSNKG